MSDTHLDSSTSPILSFQEDILLENYFPGANREAILSMALDALQKETSIIILSGEEGSGKTMLCKVLESRAAAVCNVVLFPCTVDSFEDVIRLLAAHLGLDIGPIVDRKSVEESQGKLVEHLLKVSDRLLVVFDESENIYLATLERIRRLVDSFAEFGIKMHVVFSGRPTFLENCEQLSIIDFRYSEEFVLHLEPLSLEETGEYLRKSIEKLPLDKSVEIFDDQRVKKIYDLTSGNFRAINILGEELVHTPGDDRFLEELLENISNEGKMGAGRSKMLSFAQRIKKTSLLPWAAVTVIGLFFVFIFFDETNQKEETSNIIVEEKSQQQLNVSTPQDVVETKKVKPEPSNEKTTEIRKTQNVELRPMVVKTVEEDPVAEEEEATDASLEEQNTDAAIYDEVVVDSGIEETVEVESKVTSEIEDDVAEVTDIAESDDNILSESPQSQSVVEDVVREQPLAENPEAMEALTVAKDVEDDVKIEKIVENEEVGSVDQLTQSTILPEVKEQEDITQDRTIVVELGPSPKTKRKPILQEVTSTSSEPKKQLISAQEKKSEPEKVSEPEKKQTVVNDIENDQEKKLTPVQEVIASNAHFTVEQLYQKRLLAGVTWRTGEKNNKYTVQLMVLMSKTAEKNLKMMLTEARYRNEADNFYIFKNFNKLQTIFVFYGQYPTIAQARQAQNSLPLFLKEHKPYAISIKGAIAKVKR